MTGAAGSGSCLFEGLVVPTVSFARRGLEDVVWSAGGGVVCRLDRAVAIGLDVFCGSRWVGGRAL